MLNAKEGLADDSEEVGGVSGAALGEASENKQVVLTTGDVNFLTELLTEVRDKWYEIAISLGMPQHEIADCEGKNNKIRFFQILGFWIANTSEPTLKKLTDTLCSEIVARTAVAEKISRKFMEAKRMSEGNNKSKDLAKLQSPKSTITPTIPRIESQSLPTEVADGKSTLLQVQASPRESVSYQWKKDDQPLANSSRYSGVDEDILVVRHACKGREGEYICQVSLQDKQVSSEPITLTVHIPLVKTRLLNLYSTVFDVPSLKGSWPPVVSKSFVNLALIKSTRAQKITGDYSVRGDADDIIAEKENITYEDAFSEFKSGELILVEGRPGSGKTTLVHKIIKDWRLGVVLTKSELTFLVTLRLLNNEGQDESLQNILQEFYPNESELKKTVAIIFKNDGEGVCFILDGLDEYCSPEKSIVLKLLDRKLLPQSMIIVFSRPSATGLVKKHCIGKRIEVFGFSKEQIFQYIDSFPFEIVEDGSCDNSVIKATELKEYLHSHPNIHDMCYLPIHAAMICFLFQLSKKLSPTQTRVYEEFTLSIIYRFLASQENCLALESLKDLKGVHTQSFKDLCRLAYEMTIKSKQVICSQELEDWLGGRGSLSEEAGLGLLTICPTLQKTGIHQNYAFLHLTFQEFLAAYYIANHLEDSQQIQLLERRARHMRTVWLFYSGLISFDESSQQIVHLLFKNLYFYDVFQCALESQQKYICDEVMMYFSKELSFNKSLSPLDLVALEYVLTSSSHSITCLKISYGNAENIMCLLQEVVKADLCQLHHISIFIYTNNKICNSNIFCELLIKSTNLQTLCLSITTTGGLRYIERMTNEVSNFTKLPHLDVIHSGGHFFIRKFVRYVSPCVTDYSITFKLLNSPSSNETHVHSNNLLNLEAVITITDFYMLQDSSDPSDMITRSALLKFKLFYNNICNYGLSCLSRKYNHLQLVGLYISERVIDFHSLGYLANGQLLLNALQNLDLSENNIDCDGATALAAGFKFLTALQNLSLSGNNIGSDGATALAAGFKFLTALQKLNLYGNKFGSEGSTMLAGAFKFLTTLQELNLSRNDIGSNGVIALSTGFIYLNSLQKLDLSSNKIGHDGATALAGEFKFLPGLQELNLNYCYILQDGAIALASGFKFLTALQELYLQSNYIGPDGAASLAREFRALVSLQKLNLSTNNIGSEGANALASGLSFLTKLRRCNLCFNDINLAGAKAVIASLKECDFLEELFFKNSSTSLDDCIITLHDLVPLNDTAAISDLSEAAQHKSKERLLVLYYETVTVLQKCLQRLFLPYTEL